MYTYCSVAILGSTLFLSLSLKLLFLVSFPAHIPRPQTLDFVLRYQLDRDPSTLLDKTKHIGHPVPVFFGVGIFANHVNW